MQFYPNYSNSSTVVFYPGGEGASPNPSDDVQCLLVLHTYIVVTISVFLTYAILNPHLFFSEFEAH